LTELKKRIIGPNGGVLRDVVEILFVQNEVVRTVRSSMGW